jgi:plasmid stabilization system protein ParE
MPTIVWTQAATLDLKRHREFWKTINSDISKNTVQAILKKAESLKSKPLRGSIVLQAQGLRKLMIPFGKYGFVMHYTVIEEEVLILRVYHGC